MQIFKGRDAQHLERLAAAPSNWRVLNLHYATRAVRDQSGPTQQRFFELPQLNSAIFTKHTLRDHERSMFASAPAVATKILIPLDRTTFAYGAISVFVGERAYEAAMRQWLGLKTAPDIETPKVAADAQLLKRLSDMAAFDPFLLSEMFGDGTLGVSPAYLRVSLIESADIKAFILQELTPLIRMAAGDSVAKVNKFVDAIFGHDIAPAAADFLRSLALPEARWSRIVSAWKAAIRYEAEFAVTKARFAVFLRQLAELNTYGYSERVSRGQVEALTERLRDFARRLFGNVVTGAQGFNSARRAEIIEAGQIGELKTYLQDLPEVVADFAGARALALHTLSYWEYRTRGLEHTWMPADIFCRIASDLFETETQLNAAQQAALGYAVPEFNMRQALAAL
ncbi:hypothetical protein sos41_23810 [Alphaproteobacteria bacterium SO-S41]|nr:hypothetical protein sos41_23810 [Alphaproteobacteria bacterium SO-S41]